jgi:undecaprenyl-diphosphatase
MDLLQAIVLGAVQGLTEFLPISSSAHLIIVPALLGWPQPGLEFDMALHLGTLVAVFSYFWRDLLAMALALPRSLVAGRPMGDPQSRLALLIIIGCIPAGLAGVLFEDRIKAQFYSDAGLDIGLLVIAATLIVLGLLLWLADRLAAHLRELKDLRWRDAIVIGLAQALALIPGVSRSGSTITAGLFVGLSRPAAARFSFLLGTPLILAAGLKQVLDLAQAGLGALSLSALLAGFLTSAVVGYLCIAFLLRYLATRTTTVFAVYRLALGLGVLIFALSR